MGHNPSTRDSKKAERKQTQELRTPEEVIKGIRGNLVAHLAITPNDVALLLEKYDSAHSLLAQSTDMLKLATDGAILANEAIDTLKAELQAAIARIDTLQSQVDRFREVYEQENRSHEVVFSPDGVEQLKQDFATDHSGSKSYEV